MVIQQLSPVRVAGSDDYVRSRPQLVLLDPRSPRDIVDALALVEFAAGRQPWSRTRRLQSVPAEAALLPPEARLVRQFRGSHSGAQLAVGDGWTLRAVRWRSGGAEVTVTAVDDSLAASVLEQAVREAVPAPAAADQVALGFWHHSSPIGGQRSEREITAPSWAGIRDNYPPATAYQLDRLINLTAEEIRGRLILLYGPPGTGKTSALRALARQWRSWCQVECVLDPEQLFGEPGYLLEVAVGEEDVPPSDDEDPGAARRWRLLLLEDCDELIGSGAKQATGQALARLLNLTDGLLGQGRDVLVAITTNEDLTRLHPAVVRPGRCLTQVEFTRLPHQQAAAWLGTSAGIGTDGATLAELYALRDGAAPDGPDPGPARRGLYL